MSTIKIKDKQFVPFISEIAIEEKIKELAAQLKTDYEGKRPLLIAILNGSFMFASDLFKELKFEAEISFRKKIDFHTRQ